MSENLSNPAKKPTTHIERSVNIPAIYETAGVNIDAGSKTVKLLASHAKSTFTCLLANTSPFSSS